MKKKKIRTALAAVLCILLIAGGGFTVYSAIMGQKYKNDVPQACSVSTGGGMLGGHWGAYLKTEEAGNAILQIKERETHADRERTTTYRVDPAAFERVRELVNEHRLFAASRRPYSRMQVLDGDTTTLSFDYKKGDFSVSDQQVLSGRMREGFRAVRDYLCSLAAGEGVTTLEPQRGRLLIGGYQLQYVVEDAFDGRLDEICSQERAVSPYEDCGIVLCEGEPVDVTGAAPTETGEKGNLYYEAEGERLVILYADHAFESPVYLLAQLDGYRESACPLIEEMEGEYRLYLN